MKTFLLALVLATTGLELMAQMPPGFPVNTPPRNPARNPANNPAQRAFPRFPQPTPARNRRKRFRRERLIFKGWM